MTLARQVGLFFFDNGFRPVPLEQSFIGVKPKGALKAAQVMNEICYDKVVDRCESARVDLDCCIGKH